MADEITPIVVDTTVQIDAVAIGALYDILEKKAIQTLTTQSNGRRLTQAEYAKGLTNCIMPMLNLAVQTAQQQPTLSQRYNEAVAGQNARVQNIVKQGLVLDKQASKLDQDIQLVTAQAQAIGDQVIDNRRIKIMQTLGDTYSTMAANTLTVSSDMWKVLFDKISELDTISVPAAYTIKKVS